VNVQLKSIKGVKFTWSLVADTDTTVLSVKERLLQDPEAPLADAIPPYGVSNLRFLIKGKVIPDLKQLDELAEEPVDGELRIAFTVMVSEPQSTESSHSDAARPSDMLSNETNLVLDDNLWADIRRLLVSRLGEARASAVYTQFKNSVQ
jgi:hypothetical protein